MEEAFLQEAFLPEAFLLAGLFGVSPAQPPLLPKVNVFFGLHHLTLREAIKKKIGKIWELVPKGGGVSAKIKKVPITNSEHC